MHGMRMLRKILVVFFLLFLAGRLIIAVNNPCVTITFANPTPSWCVCVSISRDDAPALRFTEDGDYDGRLFRNGVLESLSLPCDNTYYISASDFKCSNLKIEFILRVDEKGRCSVKLPEKKLREEGISSLSVVKNRRTIENFRSVLMAREGAILQLSGIMELLNGLSGDESAEPDASFPLENELLLLLHPVPEDAGIPVRPPFLYVSRG